MIDTVLATDDVKNFSNWDLLLPRYCFLTHCWSIAKRVRAVVIINSTKNGLISSITIINGIMQFLNNLHNFRQKVVKRGRKW